MGALSGTMGNVVVVSRGNTTYLRSLPNYSKDSWTPKQALSRKRFSIVTQFCKLYKRDIIVPIWNLLPGEVCGYSLFLGANIKAFDSLGKIRDYAMLRFSEGSLEPPAHIGAAKQGGEVSLSWVNDPNVAGSRLMDVLLYMALVDDKVSGPFPTQLTRGSQGGGVTLADPLASALYLFFATPDRKAFSPDKFVSV